MYFLDYSVLTQIDFGISPNVLGIFSPLSSQPQGSYDYSETKTAGSGYSNDYFYYAESFPKASSSMASTMSGSIESSSDVDIYYFYPSNSYKISQVSGSATCIAYRTAYFAGYSYVSSNTPGNEFSVGTTLSSSETEVSAYYYYYIKCSGSSGQTYKLRMTDASSSSTDSGLSSYSRFTLIQQLCESSEKTCKKKCDHKYNY